MASKYNVAGFTMGSVACPLCGNIFPLETNRNVTHARCKVCGLACAPCPISEFELTAFDAEEVAMAASHIDEQIRMRSRQTFGKVGGDNRVIEEAFCEKCNMFRPCHTFAQQTRSADEGQTIFFQCTVCKSEWSQNS